MGLSKFTTTTADGGVTVSDDVPLIADRVAVIVTGPPDATPVAMPVALTMVAKAVLLDVQTACVVTFLVEPSEYLPVAVKATVLPTATLAGLGVTVMVCSVGAGGGAATVSDAVPLTPESEAMIVTGPPAATPVATPVVPTTLAKVVLLDVHAACVVTFLVEPSE